MLTMLNYVSRTRYILKNCKTKDYATLFVKHKSEFYNLYLKEEKLITSSSHGINFFDNIMKYYDSPEDYQEVGRKQNNKPISDTKYEDNFKKIIYMVRNGF